MSRKGNCLDNSSDSELLCLIKYSKQLETFEQSEKAIHDYIYYNHKRLQVKLKGPSSVEYRDQS
ncbi:IS3 family transposase [Pasteurella sp. 19428wF3_WM03]|uniref:IS3 family transposase n=1 Tax=Pasteurella sp. 19428wF3_WM03 TaxID=2782473 RepID=UPI00142F891C|nr:IS3 family transposase [Pasteurella sp. 19428wF3_WM03]